MEPHEIIAANRRHDAEHGRVREFQPGRLRSTWNPLHLLRGKPLTDAKLNKYIVQGWFSEEFRKQRKLYQQKKRGLAKREGNFDLIEGRLIYRP